MQEDNHYEGFEHVLDISSPLLEHKGAFPVLDFLFNYPLETMSREGFTRCPTVKILCVQVGDIFRWDI